LIRPLNSGVIIEPAELAVKTAGGVDLPDTVRGRSNEGTIAAVGKGRYHAATGTYTPLDLAVGQRVLFLRWTGQLFRLNDHVYIRVDEDDVIGEVDPDDDVEFAGEIIRR